MNAGNALGYRDSLDASAAAFIGDANAFTPSDFLLNPFQFQAGWLAAAAAVILSLATGSCRGATATIGQGNGRCTN